MSTQDFILIDDQRVHTVRARTAGDAVSLDADEVQRALGWQLEPEGLCRGDVCIPVRDRAALAGPDGIDLDELASILGRPLALDVAERAAALGTGAADRAAALHQLVAPDFELPDLAGRLHRLSDHRGKKVLLIAYASW
jgi:hypothetical protein